MMGETTPCANHDASAKAGKYLTFRLAGEEFGVAILDVREIIRLPSITAVPQMPTYVRGVINLRGKVIPVIDLGLKFSMGAVPHTEETCVIVIESEALTGVIVERVDEVLDITDDQIAPLPALGTAIDMALVRGLATVRQGVKVLLDLSRALIDDAPAPSATVAEGASKGRGGMTGSCAAKVTETVAQQRPSYS